jgi:putative ABC transport system permease protein
VVREATRTGLVPILNTMSVVGLVSIPGMMTGQLLGGTPPVQAARYQFLILALIAGAVAVGTLVAVLLTVRVGLDAEHRLRVERFAGDADPR